MSEKIKSSLTDSFSQVLDAKDALEEIIKIIKSIHCLTSLMRLTKDIFRENSTARKTIEIPGQLL